MPLTEKQAAHQDRVQDDALARYPNGLTTAEFKLVTLQSADEDGRLYPLNIGLRTFGVMVEMHIKDKTVEPGWQGHHEPCWWRITDAGRAAAKAANPARPAESPKE